jgi:GrpB-like predicted nucleotidyltransferase (UPF0157 family)
MNSSHTRLIPYDSGWNSSYEKEAAILKPLFSESLIDIDHIGSTAVPGLSAKPIIDIAVLLKSHNDADAYIAPLKEHGYIFDEAAHAKGVAPERHFFRKGNPTTFHLSLAYADRGSFWKRQVLFRDYLREHTEAKDEYQRIKEEGMKIDPTGGDTYIGNKTEFIEQTLVRAGFVKNW